MFSGILQKFFSVFIAIIAFFCNTFGLFASTSDIPSGAERIAYGDGRCENFDLYIPENTEDKVDVLLLIHGGGWMMGDGSEFNEDCVAATESGYVTVNLDYDKLQNGATCDDMVNEIGTAIEKVCETLSEKNIETNKLIIAGHSAGAHLSLMYAYQNYDNCPIDIAFVVSNCAPTEFIKDTENKTTTLGKYGYLVMTALSGQVITSSTTESAQEYINSITPLNFVTPDVPPTIVIQGTADEMVPYENSTDLYNALTENGVDTIRVTYEGAGHFLGDEFTKENAERADAFMTFAEKYL